ncbi:Fe2+-dependent dioxygenase [Acinetobacter sp. ANC 4558]|uniref:Fe2+-dependent dioxygenase n=1 Tax=Acinetobacter sp. ANC 4558 TaxID=1977876 RepID=UPI000A348740|nr:Fe2+-dependent dioxygenase [Acinetobacter sp. ANC 4558]OTG87138.1 Fe2+-dependent dioxygenase [Acinetobacter sp. ANC 4558]
MIIEIKSVFSPDEAAQLCQQLKIQSWVNGKQTAGIQSSQVKENLQLDEDNPFAIQLGQELIQRISQNALFMSFSLPKRIYPPLFNRYHHGGHFGFHIDNAIRGIKGVKERVRTDLSATLFLSDPDSYEGGELVIRDTYGEQKIKLKAGDMIVYPGTSVHRVNPVTDGERFAAFFWIESLVREQSQRSILFDMDIAIQTLTAEHAHPNALLQLTGNYHNLLRMWSDVM